MQESMIEQDDKKIERIRGYYQNIPDGFGPRPAVTHVISKVWAKPELRYWYGSVGNSEARKISQESMSFGSAMHKIVADYLRTQDLPDTKRMAKEVKRSWKLWKDFYDDNFAEDFPVGMEGEIIEDPIWTKDYAGTCDWFARDTLFDWKFGNGIYDSYKLQMGAYSYILDAKKAFIVRVSKKNKNIEVLEMDQNDLDEAFECFMHCLALFEWKKKQ